MAKKKKAKKTAKKSTKKTKTKSKGLKLRAKTAKQSAKKTAKKSAKKTKKSAPKRTAKTAAPKATKAAAPKKTATPKSNPQVTGSAGAALPLGSTTIPTLSLESSDGQTVHLPELAQKYRHLVLYFYPKDDTPGCTKEACDFRDNLNRLVDKGATVVGVSPDSKESHQNFVNKYNLNFTLLADPDHALAEKMGVWKSKQFMGNSYMGVERSTFLFTDGKLSQVWSPVQVEGHVTEIMKALEDNKA